MKLKGHFKDNEKANDLNETQNKEKNHMDTEKNHHSIQTFTEAVNKVVELATKRKLKKLKSNLGKAERDALKKLSERTDVLITNAGKGNSNVGNQGLHQ